MTSTSTTVELAAVTPPSCIAAAEEMVVMARWYHLCTLTSLLYGPTTSAPWRNLTTTMRELFRLCLWTVRLFVTRHVVTRRSPLQACTLHPTCAHRTQHIATCFTKRELCNICALAILQDSHLLHPPLSTPQRFLQGMLGAILH